MKQLTIRGLDDELADHVRRLAAEEGISLNQAVLRLLRKGAGLDGGSRHHRDVIGSELDPFIGTWSEDEELRVMDAVADFERVDESVWE